MEKKHQINFLLGKKLLGIIDELHNASSRSKQKELILVFKEEKNIFSYVHKESPHEFIPFELKLDKLIKQFILEKTQVERKLIVQQMEDLIKNFLVITKNSVKTFAPTNAEIRTTIQDCRELLKQTDSLCSYFGTELKEGILVKLTLDSLEDKILTILLAFRYATKTQEKVFICLLELLAEKFFRLLIIQYPETKHCMSSFLDGGLFGFGQHIIDLKYANNWLKKVRRLKIMSNFIYACSPRKELGCWCDSFKRYPRRWGNFILTKRNLNCGIKPDSNRPESGFS